MLTYFAIYVDILCQVSLDDAAYENRGIMISAHYDGTKWQVGAKRDSEMVLTIDDVAQAYDETACDYDANDQTGYKAQRLVVFASAAYDAIESEK